MIKILHYKLDNISGEYKNPYNIKYQDNVITLTYTKYMNELDNSYNIKINTLEYNKVYDVMLIEDDEFYSLSLVEIYNYVNRNTGIRDIRYKGEKIARIAINKDNIIILLSKACSDLPLFENVVVSKDKSFARHIIDNADWLDNRIKNIKKKSKLLNDVDLYRNVSYLEAQVDVLTRVIVELSKDSNLYEIVKMFDDNSVLNIKPIEDIKNEIINKDNFRRNQEVYYEKLKEK